MRGMRLHNWIAIVVMNELRRLGLEVRSEASVHDVFGGLVGFVDVLAIVPSGFLVVEVEASTKQLRRDIEKAEAINAMALWIIVPNPKTGRSFRRSLSKQSSGEGLPVSIFTMPQVQRHIRDEFQRICLEANPRLGPRTVNAEL